MSDAAQIVAEILPLSAREFEQIRLLAYEKAGLDLRAGKETLVSARLGKKMRELNLRSFRDYYQHVVEDKTGNALTDLIDALTTNHTSFFRESPHFDFMRRTIIPLLRTRDQGAIWSAACATGEEPYSIAFSLLDELGESGLAKMRILATDISSRALAAAGRGAYLANRFDGIPMHQLRRYLLRGEHNSAGWYLVKPDIRSVVEFRRLNLMDQFTHLGPFSLIFCRNVMIYFDKATQQDLVNRLTDCLEPGGYLFIGHAESLNAIKHRLRYIQPAVYQRMDNNVGTIGRRWDG